MRETVDAIVKTYGDGRSIKASLGDNGLFVNFEILNSDDAVDIRGSVKWDGCMNWETHPGYMYHFCRPADADDLASLFRDVWQLGRQLMTDIDQYYGQ